VRRCLVRPMSTFSMKDGGGLNLLRAAKVRGGAAPCCFHTTAAGAVVMIDASDWLRVPSSPNCQPACWLGARMGIDFHSDGNIVGGTEPPSQSDRSLLFTSSQDPLERPLRSRIDLIRAKETL
jgi:hypothetical protein